MTKSDSDDSCCCKFVAASRLRISEFSRTLARPVSQVLICDTTASVIRFFLRQCWSVGVFFATHGCYRGRKLLLFLPFLP